MIRYDDFYKSQYIAIFGQKYKKFSHRDTKIAIGKRAFEVMLFVLRHSFDYFNGATGVKHVVVLIGHDVSVTRFHSFFCPQIYHKNLLLSRVFFVFRIALNANKMRTLILQLIF